MLKRIAQSKTRISKHATSNSAIPLHPDAQTLQERDMAESDGLYFAGYDYYGEETWLTQAEEVGLNK